MVSPATLAISVLIIVGYSQYAHSFCGETANLATTAGMSIRVGHLAVRAFLSNATVGCLDKAPPDLTWTNQRNQPGDKIQLPFTFAVVVVFLRFID